MEKIFSSFNDLMKAIYVGMKFEEIKRYADQASVSELNHKDSANNTSLIYAVVCKAKKKYDIIKLLLDKNVNTNIVNDNGDTAILIASTSVAFNCRIYKRLASCSDLEVRNLEGESALELCLSNHTFKNYITKIKILLEEGAEFGIKSFSTFIRCADNENSNELYDLIKNYYDFTEKDFYDNSILHKASYHAGTNCNFYIFEDIVNKTENLNEVNVLGETALIIASIGVSSDTCVFKAVEYLIQKGADKDIKDKKGYTYKDYLPDKYKILEKPRKKYFSDEPKKECSICLELKEELIYFEDCGHGTICGQCFDNNIKISQGVCHKCRGNITNVRIFHYV